MAITTISKQGLLTIAFLVAVLWGVGWSSSTPSLPADEPNGRHLVNRAEDRKHND